MGKRPTIKEGERKDLKEGANGLIKGCKEKGSLDGTHKKSPTENEVSPMGSPRKQPQMTEFSW